MPLSGWRVQPGSAGPRRDFRITVGLREGWAAEAPLHGLDEAVAVAAAWMQDRAAAGRPFLSGMFTPGAVVYAWVAEDGVARRGEEPVAIFSGEALPAYVGDVPDDEVAAMLNELAALLGTALRQQHMHVSYQEHAWTLISDAGS